jgi:hypothetical protein
MVNQGTTTVFQSGDYNYTVSNGTVTITKYTGAGGAVIIPSIIDGMPVVAIKDSAFDHCSSLTSVSIPNSVTSIGSAAFGSCSGLTSVTIPNSVTSIGPAVFAECIALTSVTIGNSINHISLAAFAGCTALTSITIPGSVTHISDGAFLNCSSLTSAYFLGNVPSLMGGDVFDGCASNFSICYTAGATGFTTPTWCPAGTNDCYPAAVCGVPTTTTTQPTTTTTINQSSDFIYTVSGGTVTITGYNCSSGNTAVVIPAEIDSMPVVSIGDNAFNYCTSLTSVIIPDSVTSIGSAAFGGCSGLTSVVIPNSVTSIGSSAFGECSGLTSVTIGNSVTSIGWMAFSDCYGLTSVTIPGSVTRIGFGAFYGCSSLASAYFSGNAPSMGSSVFDGCAGNFSICYTAGATGFTTPAWCPVDTSDCYTAAVCGASTTTTTAAPTDSDNDGIPDNEDNCPYRPNGLNLGTCSSTADNPGINCSSDADCVIGCSSNGLCIKDQRDSDNDGAGDVCDNCPSTPNGSLLGTCLPGSDKAGSICYSDADCAIGCSTNGSCSLSQEDTNADGKGDVCSQ